MSNGIGGSDGGFFISPEMEKARAQLREEAKERRKKKSPAEAAPVPIARPIIEDPPPAAVPVAPPIMEAKPKTKPKQATARTKPSKSGGSKPAQPPADEGKPRFTTKLDGDLLAEMRNAVAYHAGSPEFLTVTDFVERSIRAELDRLKRKHHGGKDIPQAGRPVRSGRPPGR